LHVYHPSRESFFRGSSLILLILLLLFLNLDVVESIDEYSA